MNRTYEENKNPNLLKKIKRLDSVRMNNVVEKCKVILDSLEYGKVVNSKKQHKNSEIDSSKLDLALINRLERIYEKDQRYRGLIGNDKSKDDELWDMQSKLDEENFKEIVEIIETEGLPTIKKVGRELNSLPWLVLHHYPNVDIKVKYLPMLEEQHLSGNLSKSQIEAYKHRIYLYRARE